MSDKYPRALAFGIGILIFGTVFWESSVFTLIVAAIAAFIGLGLDVNSSKQ